MTASARYKPSKIPATTHQYQDDDDEDDDLDALREAALQTLNSKKRQVSLCCSLNFVVLAVVSSSAVLIALQSTIVVDDVLASLSHVHPRDPIRPRPDLVSPIHRLVDRRVYPPSVHIRWIPTTKTIVSKAMTNPALEISMNAFPRTSAMITTCSSSIVPCKTMTFS